MLVGVYITYYNPIPGYPQLPGVNEWFPDNEQQHIDCIDYWQMVCRPRPLFKLYDLTWPHDKMEVSSMWLVQQKLTTFVNI